MRFLCLLVLVHRHLASADNSTSNVSAKSSTGNSTSNVSATNSTGEEAPSPASHSTTTPAPTPAPTPASSTMYFLPTNPPAPAGVLTWKLNFLWSELGATYQNAIVSFAQAVSQAIAELYGIALDRISVRNPFVVGGRRLQANVGVEVDIKDPSGDVTLAALHSKVSGLHNFVNAKLAALGVTGRIGVITDNYVPPATTAAPPTVPYTGTSTPAVTFTVTPAYIKAEDMKKQGGHAPQLASNPMMWIGLGLMAIGALALVRRVVRGPSATKNLSRRLNQQKSYCEFENREDSEAVESRVALME